MNYGLIYESLIKKRKELPFKGYSEKHHIIPRSLGGTDKKNNIAKLSAREHFIAHMLLSKMYPKESIPWIKMNMALFNMYRTSYNQKRYTPSKWYSYCKEQLSKASKLSQKGLKNSQYGKIWIFNINLKQSKKILKNELNNYLKDGWEQGRRIKWTNENKKALKLKEKQLKKESNIVLYTSYYKLYNKVGWDKFIQITGYDKSKPNLVQQFKKYVKNFKAQNGKKRGIKFLTVH